MLRAVLRLLWYGQKLAVYPWGCLDRHDYRRRVNDPYGMFFENIILTTTDEVKLDCYLIHKEKTGQESRGTIIMCHGNAMNQDGLLLRLGPLLSAGFGVFTLDYRGYGASEGRPSEKGLQRDAQAALDFIVKHPILSKKPIIVFGQSLGGAVAIDVTSRNASKITALIIENTFTSIRDIVRSFPQPVCYAWPLCTQIWDSKSKIANMPASLPILLLSGKRDQVIPAHHMESLFKQAQSRHTTSNSDGNEQATAGDVSIAFFPWGRHNDTDIQSGYQDALISFLNRVIPCII